MIFFRFGKAISLEEGKLCIQAKFIPLKIDIVLHPVVKW